MKEEISQQRCTVGAHGYTNNLPENRASKTNVDVINKKVNSKTKLSTGELRVPHWHLIIRPEGAKIIGSKEAFLFSIKNSLKKIMKLLFKLGVWKASVKSRKVQSTHMIYGKLFFLQYTDNVQLIIDYPHAVNTCPFSNRLAVSSAVAAN